MPTNWRVICRIILIVIGLYCSNDSMCQKINQNKLQKQVTNEIDRKYQAYKKKYPKMDSIIYYVVADMCKIWNSGHGHQHDEKSDVNYVSETVFIIIHFLDNIERYPNEKDFRIYPNRNYVLKKFIK